MNDRIINLKFDNKVILNYLNLLNVRHPSDFDGTNEVINKASINYYADPLMIILHKKITPLMEEKISKELIPTYCYTRKYTKNSILHEHVDRESCEVSVTYQHSKVDWPFHLRSEKNLYEYRLKQGQGLYYYGISEPHSRPIELLSECSWHSFFHWVLKDGDYQHFGYDNSSFTDDNVLENMYDIVD